MWNKQQVAVVISFIVTNCFIQISCNITSNHTSSAELIDNIIVDDSSSRGNNSRRHSDDKSEAYIEDSTSVAAKSSVVEVLHDADDVEHCNCDTSDRDCYRECLGEDDLSSLSNMFLLTAGEVLLGCAIIMGLSAVVTMMLRVCTRNRLARNNRDNPDLIDGLERGNNRPSLTSLQQSVVAKLRDRPPRYETRHNYEYRQREGGGGGGRGTGGGGGAEVETPSGGDGGEVASIRNVAVLNPGAQRPNEPPPPYETGDANSVNELPPAYTISLSTDDCCRNDANQNERVGGICNQSFACDENQQCHVVNSCCSEAARSAYRCTDRNCNILYI